MALKIIDSSRYRYLVECENVINFWFILKYLVDTPYLKNYIVKNYEGGNTLVSREAWKEEGIMFKEIKPSVFLFPYDSIGFVLDDSIHNARIIIVDNYSEDINHEVENELLINVQNTDKLIISLQKEKMPVFVSLYLLSYMKLGFDKTFLNSLAKVLTPIQYDNTIQLEYISSSFSISLKGISFIIKVVNEDKEKVFYKIGYYKKKCRREQIKEEKVRTLGYLKKKILSSNMYYYILYYFLMALGLILIFLFFRKIFYLLVIFSILAYIINRFLRKNAYRIFSGTEKIVNGDNGN